MPCTGDDPQGEGAMSRLFGDSHRQLQRRFDTERLADRIESLLVRDRLTDENRSFIEAADMFFLATADAAGRPNCSYKGGDPGFVRVLDPGTLVFPSYDGNGMYLSTGYRGERTRACCSSIPNRKRGERHRAQAADAVQPPYAGPVICASRREAFPNCRDTFTGWQASSAQVRATPGRHDPVPGWKRRLGGECTE
jgi:hypothetical protein